MNEIEYNLVIDDNHSYFKRYLQLIKTTIDKEKDEYVLEEKRITEIMSEESNNNILEQGESYLADLEIQTEQVEQLMYRSFVVGVFVFMEARITNLCEHTEKYYKQVFSYRDLTGNGISRSIMYLERVLGEKFPADPIIKFKFEIAQKVRNALVHNEGITKDENYQKIKEFIKKYPCFLRVDDVGRVSITYEYANEMINLNKYICKEISRKWKTKF